MNIRSKLTLGGILLTIVSMIVLSAVILERTMSRLDSELESSVEKRLSLAVNASADFLAEYLTFTQDQLKTLADEQRVSDALIAFAEAYKTVDTSVVNDSELGRFYQNQFGQRFKQMNPGEVSDVAGLQQTLSPITKALQTAYIAENPAVLGEKNDMLSSRRLGDYDAVHERNHIIFNRILKNFGLYDVFLVDNDDMRVVYSVYKELDFATSLKNGPYADTGLALAARNGLMAAAGEVRYTDFRPYLPSYNSPAAFMSTPIVSDGETIGVLIFQLPIDKINHELTYGGKWPDYGLGDSGETFLVGKDFRQVSESRAVISGLPALLDTLKANGVDEDQIRRMASRQTGIGLLEHRNLAVEKALDGESGLTSYRDYRGHEVFAYFRPVKMGEHRLALIGQLDREEALAAGQAIGADILGSTIVATLIIAVLAAGAVALFGNWMVKPLNRTIVALADIAEGEGDLTQRLDDRREDELGALGRYFNRFTDKLRGNLTILREQVAHLSQEAEKLRAVSLSAREGSDQQVQRISSVAAAITEMNASFGEVATNAQQSAEATRVANELCDSGSAEIKRFRASMDGLSKYIQRAADTVQSVDGQTQEIRSILDVITGIAEQTNLLALNAAIEAARAGDQGRGFAVVADEVRMLAQRTQQSTQDIGTKIAHLVSGTQTSVEAMEASQEEVRKGLEFMASTAALFEDIYRQSQTVGEMNLLVASATEEQSQVANEVDQSITEINEITERTGEESRELEKTGSELEGITRDIASVLRQFKF